MTFENLSEFARGMVLFVTFMILIIFVYNTIHLIILKRNRLGTAISIAATICTFIMFQILEMHHVGDYFIKLTITIDKLIALQIALYFIAIVQQYVTVKWQKGHISNISIKEAFDRLPAGLCYYLSNGIPVMVNDKMQEISHELLGKSVVDADELISSLEKQKPSKFISGEETTSKLISGADKPPRLISGADKPPKHISGAEKPPRLISGAETPIVLGEEGRAYSIRKSTLSIKGKELSEIIASDVSREYALTTELEKRRAKAVTLNSRLKALLSTIEYVTMNRELLQLKSALHDNIGQSILIARRYLYDPQSVDKEEMIHFWRNNIRHLISDEMQEWELPYYVISKEADKLGIKLQIIGELPRQDRLIPVIDSAISAHVGNMLKHTDGKTAIISVKELGGSYILNFANDGRQPESKIEEKGGLKNLRHEVESVGGRMKIYTVPEFGMEIILPREEEM